MVDSEDQLSTPTTPKADECFPNYSTMEQSIEKGREPGRGREGVRVDFMYVLE